MKSYLLILVLPVLAFSQGHFLNKGQQGLMLSAALFTNEEASGNGWELSFSPKSTWDFAVGYSKTEFDKDDGFARLATLPALELLELQLRIFPDRDEGVLSPMVVLAYSKGQAGRRTKLSGWTLGAGIYKMITVHKKLSVMPSLMYAFSFVNTELHPEYSSVSYEVVSATPGLSAGIAFLLHANHRHVLQVNPAFSINEEVKSFEISASYMFSWPQ